MGETIDFKIRLPEGPWVTLQGEVVYQEYPVGFEVCFTNLLEENRRLLVGVIAAHGGKDAQQILNEWESKVPEQLPQLGKRRILVADDDAMTLRM